ncbi:hypothetical protein N0V94_006361 [Neodidymelliopsis sp. IMI 364377]|nr:hypothetical protein N0V94_006361 [Neodidymelliopsis sp. IMI 364377]
MVGGINLNSSMSIDKQRTLAMDSAYMLQPGEPFPAESPLPSGNPASSLLPSTSSTSTSAPAAGHIPPGGLSTGAIIGIVIAAVCAVLFGALLFFCWGRTKSLREAIERRDGTVRRISASPNQMVEYKTQDQHVQPHHAHSASQAGYQFPHHPSVHNGSHPGSPELGAYTRQHQHQNSVSTGYFPANFPTKYTSPASTHPAYHSMSPGTPPPPASHNSHLVGQMYGHHTPPAVPTYYETFPNLIPAQEQRPVEMEAITAADPDVAGERGETVRASKF